MNQGYTINKQTNNKQHANIAIVFTLLSFSTILALNVDIVRCNSKILDDNNVLFVKSSLSIAFLACINISRFCVIV